MLTIINTDINNGIGFCISGKITKYDIDLAFSELKLKTDEYNNIVVYCEVKDFVGVKFSAFFEEFKDLFSIQKTSIEKIAVVTDDERVKSTIIFEKKFIKKAELKTFTLNQKQNAINFLTTKY